MVCLFCTFLKFIDDVFNTYYKSYILYKFYFLDDVKILANICPQLCAESVMSGLNLNILTVCDALSKKVGNKNSLILKDDDKKNKRPNTLFPVQILPYLYLGNDETARNIETLKR